VRALSTSGNNDGYFEIHTPDLIAKYAVVYLDGDKNITYSNAKTYQEALEDLKLAKKLNSNHCFQIVERSLFARFCGLPEVGSEEDRVEEDNTEHG